MLEASELQGLERLKHTAAGEPQSLEDLWLSQPALWQALGWEKPQLKLWLRCQPDIALITLATDATALYRRKAEEVDRQPDLSEQIARILQGDGKPMPLAQLKNKLPAGLLATEPMIKAAINRHPSLSLTGPMVRLSGRRS